MKWSFDWSGEETKNVQVKGFAIDPDAELVKCGLCKAIMLRDDFEDHMRYESTIQHASVEAVEELLKP